MGDLTHVNTEKFVRHCVAEALEKGHEYIQLIVDRKAPRNWDKVRIARGRPPLCGRCLGQHEAFVSAWLLDVKVVDAQAWLKGKQTLDCGCSVGNAMHGHADECKLDGDRR